MGEFWKILLDILLQAFLAFVFIGNAASLLVGIAMMARPDKVLKLNRALGQWVVTRPLEQALNKPRKAGFSMHGSQRVTGAVILLASLYVFYTFLNDHLYLAALLGLKAGGWQASFMRWLGVLGGIAAISIGFLLLLQPARLKGLEAEANRWHATDRFSELIDKPHYQPDRFISRHIYWVGGLIVAGSVYTLAMLGYYLL